MKSIVLTILIFVASIASFILSFILRKKEEKYYQEKNTLNHKEIFDYNVISVQERPLNELLQKDKNYSDIIFLGIKANDLDGKCNIVVNDCDKKITLNLPNYDEI